MAEQARGEGSERATALITSAEKLAQQGRFEEAVEEFAEALEHDPERADARFQRALLLGHLQQFEEALAELDLADDELLFDELVWVDQAQAEHDAFAEVLASRGAEVLFVEDGSKDANSKLPGTSSIVIGPTAPTLTPGLLRTATLNFNG